MPLLSQITGPGVSAVLLASFGAALLLWRQREVRQTTLLEPWCWTLASLVAISLSELLDATGRDLARGEALRYAARMTIFCPLMALLGAKRPQHRAWQFIVLSLWAVLALPAAEPLLVGRATGFDIHPARQWLFVALIVMGIANAFPTRFWPTAFLFAAAQLVLVGPYLPGVTWEQPATYGVLGIALFVMAIAVAAAQSPQRSVALQPLDRVWLDFRDRFGVLWGLRLAERVNAAAAKYGWPIALTWRGFRTSDGQAIEHHLTRQQMRALQQSLNNLLRRFVSSQWIRERCR